MMDIFNLTTKLNFSAEYVESLAPVERGIFIQYHLREKEEEAKNNAKPQGPTIGKP